ncbi:hypothetical protein Goklo_028020, partial [Gossypium klotzschianum]|nr:hypothetical protein [Gossypium klotzschianum]
MREELESFKAGIESRIDQFMLQMRELMISNQNFDKGKGVDSGNSSVDKNEKKFFGNQKTVEIDKVSLVALQLTGKACCGLIKLTKLNQTGSVEDYESFGGISEVESNRISGRLSLPISRTAMNLARTFESKYQLTRAVDLHNWESTKDCISHLQGRGKNQGKSLDKTDGLLVNRQGHGSDVDYIKPTMVHVGENVKALEISCGFNHTGAIFGY